MHRRHDDRERARSPPPVRQPPRALQTTAPALATLPQRQEIRTERPRRARLHRATISLRGHRAAWKPLPRQFLHSLHNADGTWCRNGHSRCGWRRSQLRKRSPAACAKPGSSGAAASNIGRPLSLAVGTAIQHRLALRAAAEHAGQPAAILELAQQRRRARPRSRPAAGSRHTARPPASRRSAARVTTLTLASRAGQALSARLRASVAILLQRDHRTGQLRQHRRRIAGGAADIEHAVGFRRSRQPESAWPAPSA